MTRPSRPPAPPATDPEMLPVESSVTVTAKTSLLSAAPIRFSKLSKRMPPTSPLSAPLIFQTRKRFEGPVRESAASLPPTSLSMLSKEPDARSRGGRGAEEQGDLVAVGERRGAARVDDRDRDVPVAAAARDGDGRDGEHEPLRVVVRVDDPDRALRRPRRVVEGVEQGGDVDGGRVLRVGADHERRVLCRRAEPERADARVGVGGLRRERVRDRRPRRRSAARRPGSTMPSSRACRPAAGRRPRRPGRRRRARRPGRPRRRRTSRRRCRRSGSRSRRIRTGTACRHRRR